LATLDFRYAPSLFAVFFTGFLLLLDRPLTPWWHQTFFPAAAMYALGRPWAVVTEKFDKSRSVFFSEVTAEALRDWLEVRLEWDIGGDWVFLSHQGGGQLTVYGVNQLLTRLQERGGAEGRCNPHAFRHRFGPFGLDNIL
jgi:integrase